MPPRSCGPGGPPCWRSRPLVRRRRPRCVGALAFLASFLAGARSDIHETPAHTLANFADDTNELKGAIAWVAAFVAVLALVWFAGGLVALLRSAGATSVHLSTVVLGASILAAMTAITSAIRTAPIGDLLLDNEQRAGSNGNLTPAFAQLAQTTGTLYDWLVFFGVGLGAAALVLAVSLAARRTRVPPPWLCWAGLACVPVLAVLAFFNALLLAVWFVTASIVLARRAEPRG